MPELPEVETVKNTLKNLVIGKTIKSVEVNYAGIIAYPEVSKFIKEIANKTIKDIKRRGKWLIFELDDKYIVSHLRMEGKYFLKTDEPLSRHEHVIFNFEDSNLRYHDTRKFGKMYLIDKEKLYTSSPLKDLGLEPWDEELNYKYLKEKYKNKNIPIKSALLDQGIIVGIGNIYADEILFKSGINPFTSSNKLVKKDLINIIKYTRETLESAIKLGGTTIKSYESAEGIHGLFQNSLLVHNQKDKECPNCKNKIVKTTIGGRGTYYCKKCQK